MLDLVLMDCQERALHDNSANVKQNCLEMWTSHVKVQSSTVLGEITAESFPHVVYLHGTPGYTGDGPQTLGW